jgi:hypothetical protein
MNVLGRKPSQPSSYPQARIEEPTSWPIKEFLCPKEKKELRAIKQRHESWTSYNNKDQEQIVKWKSRMQSVIEREVRSHQKLVNEEVYEDFWFSPIWEGEKRREEDLLSQQNIIICSISEEKRQERDNNIIFSEEGSVSKNSMLNSFDLENCNIFNHSHIDIREC